MRRAEKISEGGALFCIEHLFSALADPQGKGSESLFHRPIRGVEPRRVPLIERKRGAPAGKRTYSLREILEEKGLPLSLDIFWNQVWKGYFQSSISLLMMRRCKSASFSSPVSEKGAAAREGSSLSSAESNVSLSKRSRSCALDPL